MTTQGIPGHGIGRMTPLPVLAGLVVALSACSEPVPPGSQTGAAALARADRFRQQAEVCYRATLAREPFWDQAECAEAAALHQELGLAPVHFSDDGERERFQEGFAAGANILLRSMVPGLCDMPAGESILPDGQKFCEPRQAVLDAQMSRLQGRKADAQDR